MRRGERGGCAHTVEEEYFVAGGDEEDARACVSSRTRRWRGMVWFTLRMDEVQQLPLQAWYQRTCIVFLMLLEPSSLLPFEKGMGLDDAVLRVRIRRM